MDLGHIGDSSIENKPKSTSSPTPQQETREQLKTELYLLGRMSDVQELSDQQEKIEEMVDSLKKE